MAAVASKPRGKNDPTDFYFDVENEADQKRHVLAIRKMMPNCVLRKTPDNKIRIFLDTEEDRVKGLSEFKKLLEAPSPVPVITATMPVVVATMPVVTEAKPDVEMASQSTVPATTEVAKSVEAPAQIKISEAPSS